MVSARAVSCILTIIWLFVFLWLRKKTFTSKWYFCILLIMSSAGIVLDLDSEILLWNVITRKYDFLNVLLFAVLMLLVLIPWIEFDKWIKNIKIVINDRYIGLLKKVYLVLTLLSIFCIVYCLPYAIIANAMGGEAVRTSETVTLLPISPLTTLATGIATLAPIGLLLFFVGLLDVRLKKYAIGALLIPIASVIHSMTLAARELYIFLPVTFIILYTGFRNSLTNKQDKIIKNLMWIGGGFLIFYFSIITINRFGDIGSESFVSGTWGYIYQQPYVFDQTLQFFDNYKGFSKSLSFIGRLLGFSTTRPDIMYVMEFSFGTMYCCFYQMFGYSSLIVGSIIYVYFFLSIAKSCIRRKNSFSTLICFSIFIWFTISGLFYFRYGSIDAQFILYILMILFSPLYPRFLKIEYVKY